ncbi:MAG: glycoside hydrolase family 9 protein [Alphaproteobacteria bacterium]|nr:glycoside hydrolase family 9 protein [Alphaproteobacteria bacterium]
MVALRHAILPVAVLFCVLFIAHASPAADEHPVDIPLSFRAAPTDEWSKNRLEAVLASQSRIVIRDLEHGPFEDSSLWRVTVDQDLPPGRKELSFRIDVDPAHRPLWGEKLLQLFINGKEANAAIGKDGQPLFAKIVDDSGDGFVPRGSGKLRFEIPAETRKLRQFSIKTAGAENFNMTLSDFAVIAWPQVGAPISAPHPLMSELGYRPDDKKTLMIEWRDDAADGSSGSAEVIVKGPHGSHSIMAPLPQGRSIASGSRIGAIDLSAFRRPGDYMVMVQPPGPDPVESTVSFRIVDDPKLLDRHRDDAWGTFYWITDNENGPFPDAHSRGERARTFGQEWLTRDVSGGWFDAGDYGKYTVNGAYSVALMLLTGLLAPQVLDHPVEPLAGGHPNRSDWLSVAESQLDWLFKMQAPDGGANHKVASRDWPGLDVAPNDDSAVKWIMPVSSAATADYAGVMALAAKVLGQQPDADAMAKAQDFVAAAMRARDWLRRNPDRLTIESSYGNKDYGGPYLDGDDRDERFFADAAWAALTGGQSDIAAVEKQLPDRQAALKASNYEVYWGGVDLLGFWALKSIEAQLSTPARGIVDAVLNDAAQTWRSTKRSSLWGIPHGDDDTLSWGSNGDLATIGWHWLLWAHISQDGSYVADARDLAHWFFGRNPLGQTFVTGRSERAVKDPHFRPSTSGAIALPDGFLVGGPNSGGFAGDPAAATLAGLPPMRMYVDDRESYSTNEVAINWQAAWALYLSLLAAIDD